MREDGVPSEVEGRHAISSPRDQPRDGVWIAVSEFESEPRIVAPCSSPQEAEDFCEQQGDLLEDLAYAFSPFVYRFGGGSRHT
ncbi:hypothetical protein D1J51_07735 [Leucobacter sp. wl10]|nr:hypothetical protein D1J51_07735 [Leucobacter sp. wl10]